MKDVFKTLDLSDDNENFRGYTTMIEMYNALKFITMLLFIQKISMFNPGVAFLKSVSIFILIGHRWSICTADGGMFIARHRKSQCH